eukprot:scpid91857/ scgid24094/ Drebrin-like protein
MAIDLKTNQGALLAAFNDVVSDSSDTDWAVFGYDKTSNTLKVQETGDDGVEGMTEELSDSKAQYAVVQVTDPNSGLKKNIQINWMGEALRESRKGVVQRHVADVERFFRGCHVRIAARVEDDVDEKLLLSKVAKSSGANYGVHKEKKKDYGPVGPVGSVYQKTNAGSDIDVNSRNKYWADSEQQEKARIQEEQKAKAAEKTRLEAERKEREAAESKRRDDASRAHDSSVQARKQQERQQEAEQRDAERARWRAQQEQEQEAESEERRAADASRKQQWSEEQSRIASNKTKFDMGSGRDEEAAQREKEQRWEEERQRIAEAKAATRAEYQDEEEEEEPEPEAEPEPEPEAEPEQDMYQNVAESHEPEEDPEELYDTAESRDAVEPEEDMYATAEAPEEPAPAASGKRARAVYDYQAEEEGEISFDPDDIIDDIEEIDEGWWKGTNPSGEYGMFPANYVELI